MTACNNSNTNADKQSYGKIPSNTFHGVTIVNSGPRGSGYTDSEGKNFHFRIFRVHVINDTIIPAEVTVNFPSDSVALLPGSSTHLRIFLFPDTLTPDIPMAEYNFGVSGIDHFLGAGLNKPSTFTTTLQPKQECFLYIGVLVNAKGVGGLTRGKLAFSGQKINISLPIDLDTIILPADSIKSDTENKDRRDLVFGIGIDPPDNYLLIPCGQIVFKK